MFYSTMSHRRYSLVSVLRTLYCSGDRWSSSHMHTCISFLLKSSRQKYIFHVYHPKSGRLTIQTIIHPFRELEGMILLIKKHIFPLNQKSKVDYCGRFIIVRPLPCFAFQATLDAVRVVVMIYLTLIASHAMRGYLFIINATHGFNS